MMNNVFCLNITKLLNLGEESIWRMIFVVIMQFSKQLQILPEKKI